MAKSSRFKKKYRKSASKLHKAVGDMLYDSPLLSGYRIYQEYPVNKVSPYFDSGKEKFDWVILDLMVIIECHGQQHYEPVRFGGITPEEANENFVMQIRRDMAKKQAAQKAGWCYVVFKYDEKDISVSSLMGKVAAARDVAEGEQVHQANFHMVSQQIQKKNKRHQDTDYHQRQLERAREYRKEQYRRAKERQDAYKRRKK